MGVRIEEMMIEIKNLTFSYEGSYDVIFDNISILLSEDWKTGLIGRNGKGKSTFFKILLRQVEYSGIVNCNMQFELFPYIINDKSKSVYEVIEEVNPFIEEWKIIKELYELEMFDIDFYRAFSSFSYGEQTKILLAILFTKENSFLLIDEPTNHLDRHGREILAKYLKKKRSFIIISHDSKFLDNCIDHVLSINRQTIEVIRGNCTTFLEYRECVNKREEQYNDKLNSEIDRLKKASERTSKWAGDAEDAKYNSVENKSGLRVDRGFMGAKAAKMNKRAVQLKKRIDTSVNEKKKLLKDIERDDKLVITGMKIFDDILVDIKDFACYYNSKIINKPLSFSIERGDKINLLGYNGSGKSSLIKAIIGDNISYNGTIFKSKQLVISYINQDTSQVRGMLKDFALESNVDLTRLLTILYKLGFERVQFEKDISRFSDGQKKKLLIAKSLCQKAHLYIWDEPLNYIDIIARKQIKNLLRESDITMLFVEHDGDFCDNISTKEVIIERV